MIQVVSSPRRLEGVAYLSGDKSISHRALLLNSIARGTAHVSNFCEGDDGISMLRCLRSLGARIRRHASCTVTQAEECFEIRGRGPDGLREPTTVLDAGNSGTSMRLLSGLLAGQSFTSVLTGDDSLRSRPMGRIIDPLLQMGATVIACAGGPEKLAIAGDHGADHLVDYQGEDIREQAKALTGGRGVGKPFLRSFLLNAFFVSSLSSPSITQLPSIAGSA